MACTTGSACRSRFIAAQILLGVRYFATDSGLEKRETEHVLRCDATTCSQQDARAMTKEAKTDSVRLHVADGGPELAAAGTWMQIPHAYTQPPPTSTRISRPSQQQQTARSTESSSSDTRLGPEHCIPQSVHALIQQQAAARSRGPAHRWPPA